jgi:hypothetical protein
MTLWHNTVLVMTLVTQHNFGTYDLIYIGYVSWDIMIRYIRGQSIRHLYRSSSNIIRMIKSRRMRWAGHVARIRAERNAYRILVRKLEWKRTLERPRRRLVDNIKIDFRETELDSMDWIDLAQNRDQWTRWWTFGFHKLLGSSWAAAQLAASQDGLSSVSIDYCIDMSRNFFAT